jgi:cytochrome c biogenesis protein CcmG, thiol:disulfide interchange protein DsbE
MGWRTPVGSALVLRRVVFAVIGLGLVAIVVIGLTQKQGDNAAPKPSGVSLAQQVEQLAGAAAPLAALHAQASRLLPGSREAYERRLKDLRGRPVVVNGWAAWCGPCRFEFSFLQRTAVQMGRRVAFLGVDAEDNRDDAAKFLRRFPVSYPSFEDPHDTISQALRPVSPRGLPFMLFYDAHGVLQYVHQGSYPSQAALETDIRRYAIEGHA